MLQSVAYALQSDYVVMYMPRGTSIYAFLRSAGTDLRPHRVHRAAYRHTNSRSAYHYNAETQVFHQPYLSSDLLGRLIGIESNRRLLAKVPLAKDYTYKPDLPAGTGGRMSTPVTIGTVAQKGKQNSVADLAALGAANQDIGVAVFEDVLDILARQATCVSHYAAKLLLISSFADTAITSVPVFLALDVAQAYFTQSDYLTPEGHRLEPYHLSVPRTLLEYISGRKQFVSDFWRCQLAAC